jgi:hypothetical protein
LARSGLRGVPAARQPPPLCPARHLAAALHSLVAHAERFLCTRWPVRGSDACVCAMAWPGVAWLARHGLQGVPAARQRPLHGASPQLCTPWLRTPSAFCARVGPCGALMRVCVQWRGLVWRGWPAAAFNVCPRVPAPPSVPCDPVEIPPFTPCPVSEWCSMLYGCTVHVGCDVFVAWDTVRLFVGTPHGALDVLRLHGIARCFHLLNTVLSRARPTPSFTPDNDEWCTG